MEEAESAKNVHYDYLAKALQINILQLPIDYSLYTVN